MISRCNWTGSSTMTRCTGHKGLRHMGLHLPSEEPVGDAKTGKPDGCIGIVSIWFLSHSHVLDVYTYIYIYTQRERERQRETERDRQRQRETERDRERERDRLNYAHVLYIYMHIYVYIYIYICIERDNTKWYLTFW